MSPKKKVCATFRRRTPGIPSPSCPVAERMAREIRRNESSLDIYIGIEFMLDKERGVWVYMCAGRISVEWVGLVHLQNTQDPRIQSTCYYSNSLNRQIMFHTAQRMSVCNHRDRRKSSGAFIVTPRGIFLHVVLDHSLTFSFHPRGPNSMPPPRNPLRGASPHHLNPHLHRRCLLCWVNKAEPSSAWLSWRLVTER